VVKAKVRPMLRLTNPILIFVADPPSARHYNEKAATPDENLHNARRTGCRFSFPVSSRDPLTLGDTSCLMSCHLRFVSNSCHFLSRRIWGHFGMLGGRRARRPARTALRHVTATEVGAVLVPKLIDELLRSEPMCLNQIVRERLQLATDG
jgi:hypothetical protein